MAEQMDERSCLHCGVAPVNATMPMNYLVGREGGIKHYISPFCRDDHADAYRATRPELRAYMIGTGKPNTK